MIDKYGVYWYDYIDRHRSFRYRREKRILSHYKYLLEEEKDLKYQLKALKRRHLEREREVELQITENRKCIREYLMSEVKSDTVEDLIVFDLPSDDSVAISLLNTFQIETSFNGLQELIENEQSIVAFVDKNNGNKEYIPIYDMNRAFPPAGWADSEDTLGEKLGSISLSEEMLDDDFVLTREIKVAIEKLIDEKIGEIKGRE